MDANLDHLNTVLNRTVRLIRCSKLYIRTILTQFYSLIFILNVTNLYKTNKSDKIELNPHNSWFDTKIVLA